MTGNRKRITDANGVEYWETTGSDGFGWTLCSDGDHPLNKAWGAHLSAASERLFKELRAKSIFADKLAKCGEA